MAIEKVKRINLLVPVRDSASLVNRLYQMGIIHVVDTFSYFPTASKLLRRFRGTAQEAEDKIQKLEFIASILEPFLQRNRSFIDGFFPVPIQITEEGLEKALSSLEIEPFYENCKTLSSEQRANETRLRDIEQELESLQDLLGLPWSFDELRAVKKVFLKLGLFPQEAWDRFSLDPKAHELFAWQVIPSPNKRQQRAILSYLPNDKEEALALLNSYNFKELTIPQLSGSAEERVAALESQRRSLLETKEALRQTLSQLTNYYQTVEILLGYWESERNRLSLEANFASSKRLALVSGYIRVKDIPRLENELQREFFQTTSLYEDPTPEENVPVSLSLGPFFRPAQFLVNMFGLPNYFAFDPTPYIILNFLFFFGLCFSDAIYGLCLMGLSYGLMRRFRTHPNLRNFFKLFLYAGVSTAVCGALTGGWAGDLYDPKYLGEGNLLLRLKEATCLVDPLSNIMLSLAFVLGLGILNQFYALALRMYREFRLGRPFDALLDGGLWLIFLTGLVFVVSTIFIPLPPGVIKVGKVLLIFGTVGLFLSQGRREEGLVLKLVTGLVSIYGILGTYGCTSFISDVISYSRLLALGLTTSIIAMSFNIIASLVGSAGIIFFILVLVFGHLLNFFISVIGSFVHPARLIFLEFFSRFYEAGAVRFKPFGFQSQRVQLIRP